MILALAALLAGFGGGVLVGRASLKSSVSVELAKIEADLSAVEKEAVAKIKALLHIK